MHTQDNRLPRKETVEIEEAVRRSDDWAPTFRSPYPSRLTDRGRDEHECRNCLHYIRNDYRRDLCGHETGRFRFFVAALRDYLATLQKLVADARTQGKAGPALAQAVMPALIGKYGQWGFFKYLAQPSILQMDAELSGKKRIPQPGPIDR